VRVNVRDLFDALRRKRAGGGGDGRCRTKSGETLDLELFKFDT
jgi:hypothetical protein